MKYGFRDPLEYKSIKPKDTSVNPAFKPPGYDKRSSVFVREGQDYGVGHKQPVGHKGDAKLNVDTLPFGDVDTLKVKY